LAVYPRGWLERGGSEPASDLDLVVLLLNSLDLIAEPPDRLTDLRWFSEVLTELGHDDIARALRPRDLQGLRELRESLRAVFEAASAEQAMSILNRLLRDAPAIPQLVKDAGELALRISPDARGLAALRARLPAALARHLVDRGIARLGTCAASPCECAFIDHTRGATRRYCCGQCNDRAASRLYRQRRRRTGDASAA
jgi:predicted RNA-binding Zn ribbon-like protein